MLIEKGVLVRNKISDGGWRCFLERQDDLTLRRGDSTGHDWMDAVNQQSLNQYLDLLEDTLTQYDLLNSPSRIYNVDETGIPLDARTIVTCRGIKKVRNRAVGRKGHVTIVACGNAAGQALPPMMLRT